MPGYRGHLVGGAAAFACTILPVVLLRSTTPILAVEWLICCLAGSLFPDIDIKSKGQKYFYYVIAIWILLLFSYGYYTQVAFTSILSITPMVSKHRGIFHRYWFVIGMPLAFWCIGYTYYPKIGNAALPHVIFFITGAISHLLLDYQLGNFWFFKLPFFGEHAKRK